MYDMLYETIADGLVSHGFVCIEEALPLSLTQSLLSITKESALYKNAGISSSKNVHVDTKKRRDKIRWLDEDRGAQSQYLAFTQGLQEYLNRTLYLGLHYYEAHFALYEKGDFYEKHLDAFKGSKNRVVTTVFYLNEEWSQENGGELVIFDKNDKELKRVVPKAGTLVIFLSDKFPHEVLLAKAKRHSIAGWFRVDDAA